MESGPLGPARKRRRSAARRSAGWGIRRRISYPAPPRGSTANGAGDEVRLLDLQVFRPPRYRELLESWRPEAIGFSLNYLANVPEVVELARTAKAMLPGCRVMVGGHSASFVTRDLLEHAGGAIDCTVRGEGEGIAPRVLESFAGGAPLESLPGVVTPDGSGPPPLLLPDPAAYPPARHLAGP